MRAWWVLHMAALLLANAVAAAAAPEATFSIDWHAPPGCPGAREVEERVAQLIGIAGDAGEPVRARAAVTSDARGQYHADVEVATSTQRSTRRVDGESCQGIADAVALIVAFAVDPGKAPLPPAPTPTAETIPPAPAPPPPTPVQDATLPFFVRGAGRVDVGALPSAAFGGELAVGWNPAHVDVEVSGGLVGPSHAELGARPGEGASIHLTEVGARACYELFDSRVDVGPCAGAGARWLSASGFGSTKPADAIGLIGVVSVGAIARARLARRIALRLDAGADVPLSRPSFVIDTAGTVHKTAPWGARATLGAELRF